MISPTTFLYNLIITLDMSEKNMGNEEFEYACLNVLNKHAPKDDH